MNLKFCPTYGMVLNGEHAENGNLYVARTRCKQWNCPYCAVVNKNVWMYRIIKHVLNGKVKHWYFWTLTLLGDDHKGLVHSLVIWRDTWDKLMKRIRRDLGKVQYVRVFETHQDGTLHIHMLCDKTYGDVVQRGTDENKRHHSDKLQTHLDSLNLGYIHDIKPIVTSYGGNEGNAINVASYATKYMTKDLQSDVRQALKAHGFARVRMIQTSQKWYDDKPDTSDIAWSKGALQYATYRAKPAESEAIDVTYNEDIEHEDFYEYTHYPNRIVDLLHQAQNEKPEYK